MGLKRTKGEPMVTQATANRAFLLAKRMILAAVLPKNTRSNL
jgi:hypothetical protein